MLGVRFRWLQRVIASVPSSQRPVVGLQKWSRGAQKQLSLLEISSRSYSSTITTCAKAKSNSKAVGKAKASNNSTDDSEYSSSSKKGDVAVNIPATAPSADGAELINFHTEYFQQPSAKSVYDYRSGAYQEIDDKDLLRYFPEGLAGETKEEFEFSNHKRWMIRDSTKIVYRLIEESEKRLKYNGDEIYEKNLQKSRGTEATPSADEQAGGPQTNAEGSNSEAGTGRRLAEPAGFHRELHVPRLTDRADWPQSRIHFTHFGRELYQHSAESSSASSSSSGSAPSGFIRTRGEGSQLEQTMDNLRTATADIPDRLMLTGT